MRPIIFALIPVVFAADYGDICASVGNCSYPADPCPLDSECTVADDTSSCGLILRCSPPIEATAAPTPTPPEQLMCSSTGACNVPDMQCPVGYDCGNPTEQTCGFLYFCVPNGETVGPTKSPAESPPDEEPTSEPTANPTQWPGWATTRVPTDAPTGPPLEDFTAPPTNPTPPPSAPPTLSEDELNSLTGDDPETPALPVDIEHSQSRASMDNSINVVSYLAYFCVAGVLIAVVLFKR